MTDLQAVVLFGDLALILVLARVMGRVARALGQPPVIGEIVGGILIGPTLFHGELDSAGWSPISPSRRAALRAARRVAPIRWSVAALRAAGSAARRAGG